MGGGGRECVVLGGGGGGGVKKLVRMWQQKAYSPCCSRLVLVPVTLGFE